MSADVARDYWDDWGLVLLNLAMGLGPLAVSLDLFVGYALVKPLCASGQPYLLRTMSLAALLIAGAGAFIGWKCLFRLTGKAHDDGGRVIDRSYFVALVAIGLDVLCAALILTAAGARALVPCE
jgi:hypothetical protein